MASFDYPSTSVVKISGRSHRIEVQFRKTGKTCNVSSLKEKYLYPYVIDVILFAATLTPAPSPDQTPPGTPPNEMVADNDALDALVPDLVRENRAKGVVLRAYRVEGKSSPLEPAAVRRESLRRTKRGSQELDAQGLVSKLSRLVQWPFQGFVSDDNGNNVRTTDCPAQLTSSVTTTSTMTGEFRQRRDQCR